MIRFCCSTVVALLLIVSQTKAERVVFQLSGVVSEISDRTTLLPPTIFEGAHVSGELFYDTSFPDEFPDDPQRGRYRSPPGGSAGGMTIKAGDLLFQTRTDNDFYLEIDDDLPYFPFDPDVVLPASDWFVIPDVYLTTSLNVEFVRLQLLWRDPSASVFHSDSLPQALNVAVFPMPIIDIAWSSGVELGDGEVQTFRIRIQSAVAVPEPTTVGLLAALGLGRFITWRRTPT